MLGSIVEAAGPFGRWPQHEADDEPGGIRTERVVGEERWRVSRHDPPDDVRRRRHVCAPTKD